MTSLQQEVVDYIKHDRTLNGGRNLYTKLPNKSLSFQATLNRLGATPSNLKHVIYQLCKAVGLQERQMNALLSNPVEPKEDPGKDPQVVVFNASDIDTPPKSLAARVLAFSAENAEWDDIRELAAEIKEGSERKPEGRSKEDLLNFIQAEREHVIVEEAKEVPINVKRSIKLRDQFPFLKEKDCPDVLKLLVNDLITSYEKYKEGREKLWNSMTEEEEKILARDIVDDFIENKQAYVELEHYRDNGTLLGEHPIFRESEIKAELDEMDGEELRKRYQALRTNVSRNQKKAEKEEDAEKKAEYEATAADYAWQRDYVKELLESRK